MAHLFLLHGIFPNGVLNEAQYLFNPSAWSLSLEWQFYLIAPLVIGWMCGRGCLALVACIVVAFAAYQRGWFGQFYNPSLIFGAGPLLLLGIATRLTIARLPGFTTFPWAILIGSLSLIIVDRDFVPVVAWIAMISYIRTEVRWQALDGGVGQGGRRSLLLGLHSASAAHHPGLVDLRLASLLAAALVSVGYDTDQRRSAA